MSDDVTSNDKISLTRRQALAALGVGAVAATGAAAAVGVEATTWAKREAEQQLQDLKFELDSAKKQTTALEQELFKYKGLVALYETLEQIALDSIVAAALAAFKTLLDGLEAGVDVLRAGIVTAENALDNFESAFASLRSALDGAEAALANVAALFKNAQDLLAQASSPLLPLVDQTTRFFDDLLGKIPFGVGDQIRKTVNGIIGLLVAIPSLFSNVGDGLLKRLREEWFSEEQARNLEATLAQPISRGVLQPARQLLDNVAQTLEGWETQVSQPINAALAKREIVRQQITEYKRQNKL